MNKAQPNINSYDELRAYIRLAGPQSIAWSIIRAEVEQRGHYKHKPRGKHAPKRLY